MGIALSPEEVGIVSTEYPPLAVNISYFPACYLKEKRQDILVSWRGDGKI